MYRLMTKTPTNCLYPFRRQQNNQGNRGYAIKKGLWSFILVNIGLDSWIKVSELNKFEHFILHLIFPLLYWNTQVKLGCSNISSFSLSGVDVNHLYKLQTLTVCAVSVENLNKWFTALYCHFFFPKDYKNLNHILKPQLTPDSDNITPTSVIRCN